MLASMRRSGIPEIGDVPLGTHFCHFFEETAELYDTAVPFFAAGLEAGELCFWLLAEPLTGEGAREALRRAVPDADERIANGAVILQPALTWYLRDGELDTAMLAESWTRLLADAGRRGFSGVRVAGCVTWVRDDQWPAFRDYDASFEEALAGKPMIVLCSFPLSQTGTARILDVAHTHHFALANRGGRAERLDTPVFRMRQLDVRNRRQVALSALGLTAIRERDLGTLMQDAVALAAHTLGTGRSIVWRLRPQGGDMIVHTSIGWDDLPRDATVPIGETSAAHFIVSNDQPVSVADVQHDARFRASWVLRDYGVATLLSAIIRGRERPWGLLSVHSMTPRPFDADDAEFLQSMANVLALAVERKEAEDERAWLLASAETALAQLHAIQTITDTALARMGLEDLLAELLARLRNTLHTDHAAVLLLNEQRTHLAVRAVDGFPFERLAGVRVPVESELAGAILKSGKAMIFDSVFERVPHWTASLGVQVRAAMGAPLVVEGKITGIVCVSSIADRRFDEDDLELLRVVADRVAPAIERARLTESVRAGHERLESLSRRLLAAQEEERRRVAIELHDELGQLLTAININLGSSPPNVKDAVESVERAMQSVRDLALDLRPAMLDDLGLAAALRWYADRFARQTGVQTHLAVDETPRLDAGVATAAFRVAQEALTNVARHASAKNVWLALRRANGMLELTVRDDGSGFDVAAASARAARGESLGLVGMEERVSLAGGTLSIVSEPAGGAEIRARFRVGGGA